MRPNAIAIILSVAKKPANCPSAAECRRDDAVLARKETSKP